MLNLTLISRFQLIEHEEYQSYDKATSATTTYIKGRGILKKETKSDPKLDNFHIFETSEYVIPPNENEAVFIMTSFIKTFQKMNTCDEVILRF